ncbi:hypothetical protein KBF61_02880 [Candidatus Saccharibacteria bacterium]|nr:hypothetical protein [Candidatus Saccharibacteria bacterium]
MSTVKNYQKEITNHLEFLGYELDDLKVKEGFTYIAKKSNKSTLLVRIYNNTCILTTRWSGFQVKALKSKDFFEIMNDINRENMGKWYYEVNEEKNSITILTEMDYYDYEKTTFGTLVENLENEVQRELQKFSKFMED